jgi:uncharacterized membrane protein YfcA
MTPEHMILLYTGLLAVSFLYSTVGHAGASGYIAVMGLLGMTPGFIKPAALILNILVASIAAWQFYRAGHFQWRIFWPYALFAVPCAFLGGFLVVPDHVFRACIGIVLLFSAGMLVVTIKTADKSAAPRLVVSMGVGAGLGLMAGLTGTGGGIFLTPTLVLFRWTTTKTASATSALFILVNSISGLLGAVCHSQTIPSVKTLAPMLATVLIGGTIGSHLGSRKFSKEIVKMFLACVLAVASFKLMRG